MSDQYKIYQPRYLVNRAMYGFTAVLGFICILFFICINGISRVGVWIEERADEIYPPSTEYLSLKDDDEQR